MRRRVRDNRVRKVVKDGLAARVLLPETGKFDSVLRGTPQGGVLSPLLANIYLHEFDLWVHQKIEKYSNDAYRKKKRKKRKRVPNPEWQRIYRKEGAEGARNVPLSNPFADIRYVRYADDFLIAIQGPRADAVELMDEVNAWLHNELKLELKTQITHISRGVLFLGHRLSRATVVARRNQKGQRGKEGKLQLKLKVTFPTLDIPIETIVQRLRERGFCDGAGSPTPCFNYLHLPQSQTNVELNRILKGYLNWAMYAGEAAPRTNRI